MPLRRQAKSKSETYDYILFDDQQIYTYEETPTSPDGELVVSDATTPAFSAMATSGQTDFIDDGVGGKQKISKIGSVGSYLSTVLKLPTGSSQVSDVSSSHSPYNYAGFEYTNTANSGIGSWQSDMGLQYYQNLGFSGTASGWKPILTLKQKTGADTWTAYQINFDSTYNQAQYHNGFKPGTSTTIYTYYNYNGKVRMKLTGTTICQDMACNVSGDYSNTTIMESNSAWNITKIDDFKLLSTVVSSNNTGLNKAVYSSIKVDGVAVPSSYFLTPQQDHALVTRDSSNTVTIDVNSSLYTF